MKAVIKAIFIVLVLIPVICSIACTEKQANNNTQIQILEHNLSIHKFGGDVLQSLASVDGKAKNNGSSAISYASIYVNFFDKDGNLLNTSSATKDNLGAGEIWQFSIRFTSPDAWKTVRYDISVNTR